jgi:hypothetical protein
VFAHLDVPPQREVGRRLARMTIRWTRVDTAPTESSRSQHDREGSLVLETWNQFSDGWPESASASPGSALASGDLDARSTCPGARPTRARSSGRSAVEINGRAVDLEWFGFGRPSRGDHPTGGTKSVQRRLLSPHKP